MSIRLGLNAGQWHASKSSGTFRVENFATGEKFPDEFSMSALSSELGEIVTGLFLKPTI
jgi:hypothetical protein